MGKKISIILCLLMLTLFSVASAEKYQIVAEGNYVVGDRDTREIAKKHAVQDAMRIAVEKAGVYVESYSETKHFELTKDQVRTIAAGVVKVLDESIDFYDNGSVCRAVIYASVNTDDINLEELLNTRTETNGRKYRVRQAPQERPVTALIIDYSRFRDNGSRILPLGINDCIKSEDGTIVFDKAISGAVHGSLCYQDKDAARVYAKAGSRPIVVEPIYFEASTGYKYYWKNPVLKKEDADDIMEMNDKFQFLENGKVYIIKV